MTAAVIRYPTYKRVTASVIIGLFGLWVAYLLLWPSQGSKAAGTGIAVGAPAPDFELKTMDGKTYRLSELKGRPVMINFWASWCAPCRAEMPALQAAYKEHESTGFLILAVNLNEADVAITAFQQKLGLTFPIVIDKEDKVSRLYDIVPLPTSYFVDRNGIVQGRWQGEIRTPQLQAMLKKIL